jgi:dodecin
MMRWIGSSVRSEYGPALLEAVVTNRTYRVTEIVGTSPTSIEDAVRNGVNRAGETLRHLDWLEVTEIRGQIVDGTVQHWQVGVKIGFRLEDS